MPTFNFVSKLEYTNTPHETWYLPIPVETMQELTGESSDAPSRVHVTVGDSSWDGEITRVNDAASIEVSRDICEKEQLDPGTEANIFVTPVDQN